MIPTNSMRTAAVVAAMMVPAVAWATQQQPMLQTPGTVQPRAQAAVTGCAQAHPLAERTIEMTNRRLEAARQANSPAAMRAAMDDMQAALRQLRVEIAPCAGLQSVAAADPSAGHVMPGTVQTPAMAPGTPVVRPGSTPPAPAAMAGNAAAGNPAAAVGPKPAPAAPIDHSKMPMGDNAPAGTPTATGRKPAAQPRVTTPAVAKPTAAVAGHDMANMNTGASSPATTLDLPTRPQELACATKVDPKTAPRAAYAGKTYYFCTAAERDQFVKAPAAYRPKP